MKESLINIINLLLSLPVVYLILLKQSLLHFFFFFYKFKDLIFIPLNSSIPHPRQTNSNNRKKKRRWNSSKANPARLEPLKREHNPGSFRKSSPFPEHDKVVDSDTKWSFIPPFILESSNFFTRAVPPIKRDTTCDSFVKLLKSFFSRDFTLSRASFSNRCERNKATFSFLFFFHPGTCIHFFFSFFLSFFPLSFFPVSPSFFHDLKWIRVLNFTTGEEWK